MRDDDDDDDDSSPTPFFSLHSVIFFFFYQLLCGVKLIEFSTSHHEKKLPGIGRTTDSRGILSHDAKGGVATYNKAIACKHKQITGLRI